MTQAERARISRAKLKQYNRLCKIMEDSQDKTLARVESMAYGTSTNGERVKSSALSNPTERGAILLAAGSPNLDDIRRWIDAINDAWAELTSYAPQQAELMEKYFQLGKGDGWDSHGMAKLRYDLCEKWAICQADFYRRLNEVVETVVYHAARYGCFDEKIPPE